MDNSQDTISNLAVLQTKISELSVMLIEIDELSDSGISQLYSAFLECEPAITVLNAVEINQKFDELIDCVNDMGASTDTAAQLGMLATLLEAFNRQIEYAILAVENLESTDSVTLMPQMSGEEESPKAIPSDAEISSEFYEEMCTFADKLEEEVLNLNADADNPEAINSVFRILHTIKGNAAIMNLERLANVAHHSENLISLARDKGASIDDEIIHMLLVVSDHLNKALHTENTDIADDDYDYVIDKLNETISLCDLDILSDTSEKLPCEQATRAGNENKQRCSVIRVQTSKLDTLIDMVGELVISSNLIQQDKMIKNSKNIEFNKKISYLSRAISELQKTSMTLRMIPIEATFNKMKRVVYSYLRNNQKQIDFQIEGGDTEVDKSIVDCLYEPLVHLVRNSLDHGIEYPQVRTALKKPPQGKLTLKAYHQGDSIIIDVCDDGAGIDVAKVSHKAVEQGLINSDNLPEQDILQLILSPGFSTAEKISDISGRGVGMDVVNKAMEDLRGRIEIISQKGKGTTFRLSFPLTLAIIEGMQVQVAQQIFIIPLVNIVRFIRPDGKQLNLILHKSEMYNLNDEIFPVYWLCDILNIEASKTPQDAVLVIINSARGKFALGVDQLIGIQDVVVKKLSEAAGNNTDYIGSTILGSGEVSLILNVNNMM